MPSGVSSGASKDRIYKVVFLNQGSVVELYARQVGQGELFGFVEVEDLVFINRPPAGGGPLSGGCGDRPGS